MAITREHFHWRLPIIATVFVLVVIAAAAAATHKLWLPRVHDLMALSTDRSSADHAPWGPELRYLETAAVADSVAQDPMGQDHKGSHPDPSGIGVLAC